MISRYPQHPDRFDSRSSGCSRIWDLKFIPAYALVLLVLASACSPRVEERHPVSPQASVTTSSTPQPNHTSVSDSKDNISYSDFDTPLDSYGGLSTIQVVRMLTPSIVQITTEVLSYGFFNEPIPHQGVGTGLILDDLGHILTNYHVIYDAQNINVTLSTSDVFEASLVGGDFSTDLAIIKINATNLKPALLGTSSNLQVGEDVIAIGHALGLLGGPTVSKGVVSALGRTIYTDAQTTIVDLIQTDASINPGNSGGALANQRGEVVGVNTAIIQGSQGIGFAINIDDAKAVAHQLIKYGYVNRGFLGIAPVNVSPGLAKQMGLPVDHGILVTRVINGSAAQSIGLLIGDVITNLGDQKLSNTGELSKFLLENTPGTTVSLTYYRGDTHVRTDVTLGDKPKA